jgi:hypothetical protein
VLLYSSIPSFYMFYITDYICIYCVLFNMDFSLIDEFNFKVIGKEKSDKVKVQ